MLQLKELGGKKKKTLNPKKQKKEKEKIMSQVNEIDNRKTIEKNKQKNWLFEKVNKIGNPLDRWTRKKKKRKDLNLVISEMKVEAL